MFKKHHYTAIIRDTLDWRAAKREDLRDDAIRNAAALWDSTFSLSFMECRAAIKDIAEENQKQVKGLERIEFAKHKPRRHETVLLCDDDDWYHPDLVNILKNNDYSSDMLVWQDGVHGFHARWQGEGNAKTPIVEQHLEQVKLRPLADATAYSAIKTNNFALTPQFFKSHKLEEVLTHVQAANAQLSIKTLDAPLSLVNRHPCSYLVLVNTLHGVKDEAEGRVRLQKLVSDYISADISSIQPEFSWSLPSIKKMQQLFSGISSV